MFGYVYKITNQINGLIYIGQHKASCFDEKYWGSSRLLKSAIQQYGYQHFTREILCECCSAEELNEKEIYWIAHFNSQDPDVGYNRCNGGNSNAGFHQTEFQKQRMKEVLTGKKMSEEACKHMSIAKTGSTHDSWNRGKVRMQKGDVKIFAKPEDVEQYINDGYNYGWLEPNRSNLMKAVYTHKTYINNGSEIKCVENSELHNYLNNGWVVGRIESPTRGQHISNSKRGAICITKDSKCKYVKRENVPQYIAEGWTPSSSY